jgi:hypothetical protein
MYGSLRNLQIGLVLWHKMWFLFCKLINHHSTAQDTAHTVPYIVLNHPIPFSCWYQLQTCAFYHLHQTLHNVFKLKVVKYAGKTRRYFVVKDKNQKGKSPEGENLYALFNLSTRSEWLVNIKSWPLYPQERDPVPIVHLLGKKEYRTKDVVFHFEASI